MSTVIDEAPVAPPGPAPSGPGDGSRGPMPTVEQPGRPRRPARRRRLRIVALVILAGLVPTSWSYVGYLRAPGNAPVTVRTSDWLRDHGFESAVNNVEQWWYTRKRPSGTRPPTADIPTALRTGTAGGLGTAITAATTPAPGEGTWTPVGGLAAQASAIQQTYVRPDPRAPSVAANLVRFDQQAVKTVLVPGTVEPGGPPWAWKSEIPRSQRPLAIAAFNAGFKFRHTPGGFYSEGRSAVRPLQAGLASLVIRKDGTADVARWGRDATMTPDVVSVRQNLALIVDQGRPAPGLASDRGLKWGTSRSQFQYTWRSAVGVDASGRLIYAAGSKMTLAQLATALVDAGAVRAMQLDIHDGVVTFNWYRSAPATALGVTGTKLMPSMQRSATRYLAPDQRDFVTVLAR